MALLIGYGAAAINPYLAFQTIEEIVEDGHLHARGPRPRDGEEATSSQANDKGLLKTFAKMGISTLARATAAPRSSRPWAGSRPRGALLHGHGLPGLGRGLRRAGPGGGHAPRARLPRRRTSSTRSSTPGGLYQWRARGEKHSFNPRRSRSCRSRSNARATRTTTSSRPQPTARRRGALHLRGPARFKRDRPAVPLDEVEPATEIVKRFCTGRHVLRLDLAGGAPDPGHRHEPARRQEQHRRGR